MLYWLVLGGLIRKLEGAFGLSKAGLILAVVCFLPLVDYVVMTFWSASMALCTVVVPVLLLLKWCQLDVPRAAMKRRKRPGQFNTNSSIVSQPTAQ